MPRPKYKVKYKCDDIVPRVITYNEYTGSYLAYCRANLSCRFHRMSPPQKPPPEVAEGALDIDRDRVIRLSAGLWEALDSTDIWRVLKEDQESAKLLDALKKALKKERNL